MSTKNNQDFLETWLIPGLGPEIYKMTLKQFSQGNIRKLLKATESYQKHSGVECIGSLAKMDQSEH